MGVGKGLLVALESVVFACKKFTSCTEWRLDHIDTEVRARQGILGGALSDVGCICTGGLLLLAVAYCEIRVAR